MKLKHLLNDGGKHSGDVDFPVSFALTRSELPSYNSAILDVYFTEKHFIDKKKFDFIRDIQNYYKVDIFPTVSVFGSIDIKTGKSKPLFL
ncbi:hypothetical protein [Lebetimonas sp. JH292]|uniref:hypothetical protein n=1 Tax=Lebetimonas sp. JH292 TaxID=990068 RepID=UPI0004658C0F|nr:hypothetical protein [Lebetimonas sp. JH292]